jgi:hypothetical protein
MALFSTMAALVAKRQGGVGVRAFTTGSVGFVPRATWYNKYQPTAQPTLLSRGSHRGMLFMSTVDNNNLDEINEKLKLKGDEIRQLKADGIDKAGLAPHIEELKALKSQLPVDESAPPPKPKKKEKGPKEQNKKASPAKKSGRIVGIGTAVDSSGESDCDERRQCGTI